MNTHTAHFGPGLQTLHAALHLPRRTTTLSVVVPPGLLPQGWLERLALWAERQPMHHRLGSYTRT